MVPMHCSHSLLFINDSLFEMCDVKDWDLALLTLIRDFGSMK